MSAVDTAGAGEAVPGRNGLQLERKWQAGPRTYLGLCTFGFPNLFMVAGPGSPSVLSNMMVSIEQHVDWIADCLAHMRQQDFASIEPGMEFEDDWVKHVNQVADATLYRPSHSSRARPQSSMPSQPSAPDITAQSARTITSSKS